MSSPTDPTVLDRELYTANPVLAHAGMQLAGRYRLVTCRGRGGIGEVWEALQVPSGRRVAVKLLLPGWWGNDSVRARFVREGRLARTLQHRHIVEVLDVGETREGQSFIAMELLEGLPLHTVIEQQGPMSWPRVVRILQQLCGALDHAHALRIVHRDVKPSNVMLANAPDELDRCKLVDFGIAKQNLAVERHHLTGEGQMLGSPGFMSPEQLQGRPIDIRGDVYGLGCTAVYLLTGQVPFPGKTVPELIHNALYAEPRALTGIGLDNGLRRQIEAVLHRAVHRDPEQRHATMLDFVVALNQVGLPSSAPSVSSADEGADVEREDVASDGEPEASAREEPTLDVPGPGPGHAIVASDVATTISNLTGPRGVVSKESYSPALLDHATTDRVSWGCPDGFVEIARVPSDVVVVQMSGRIGSGAAWLFAQHLGPLLERCRPAQLFWHLGSMQGYPPDVRDASLRCLTEHRECIESVHLLNGPGLVGIAVSLATVTLRVPPYMYADHDAWCDALQRWTHGDRK